MDQTDQTDTIWYPTDTRHDTSPICHIRCTFAHTNSHIFQQVEVGEALWSEHIAQLLTKIVILTNEVGHMAFSLLHKRTRINSCHKKDHCEPFGKNKTINERVHKEWLLNPAYKTTSLIWKGS